MLQKTIQEDRRRICTSMLQNTPAFNVVVRNDMIIFCGKKK